MTRQPFAWEGQVRREIFDEELSQISELPYSLWRDMIGSPMTKQVRGRDERTYQITIASDWVRPGQTGIRVSLTLKPIGWGLHRAVTESFLISEDGQVQGEGTRRA